MVYNDQQNLPVSACSGQDRNDQCLSSAPEMTSSQPNSKPADATQSPAPAQPQQAETRAERLARIKQEIEAGTYDTPEKLEAAIDRMMGVLID